jgi:hypothetical protein
MDKKHAQRNLKLAVWLLVASAIVTFGALGLTRLVTLLPR